ncbi:MAG: hypothetical protein AB7N80_06920 [Bdellovibrionales bacterium]
MNFQNLYRQMFHAKQNGQMQLADELMLQMEELRKKNFSSPNLSQIEEILPRLPSFAARTLGQSQADWGGLERANCINAAFNFHNEAPRSAPYSTMEFLDRIQAEFRQIQSDAMFQFGDLVVIWSRVGGAWDDKTIDVHQINKNDPDFPYGLVFDHVMVRLTEDLVFHKPDPVLESRYQIDFLNSVVILNVGNRGFELTFHRRSLSI